MKENNKLLIIIGVMAAVIVILSTSIAVFVSKNYGKDKTTEEVTTQATVKENDDEDETSEEVAAEDEEDTEAERHATKSDAKEKKLACSVTVSDDGNWPDGDKFVYQYKIRIDNKSKSDVSDWKVVISGFKGGEIGDNWNGKYKISGDELTITAVDYNGTIPQGGNIEMGLQVKYKSSSDSEKAATLYVNGEEYTEA